MPSPHCDFVVSKLLSDTSYLYRLDFSLVFFDGLYLSQPALLLRFEQRQLELHASAAVLRRGSSAMFALLCCLVLFPRLRCYRPRQLSLRTCVHGQSGFIHLHHAYAISGGVVDHGISPRSPRSALPSTPPSPIPAAHITPRANTQPMHHRPSFPDRTLPLRDINQRLRHPFCQVNLLPPIRRRQDPLDRLSPPLPHAKRDGNGQGCTATG